MDPDNPPKGRLRTPRVEIADPTRVRRSPTPQTRGLPEPAGPAAPAPRTRPRLHARRLAELTSALSGRIVVVERGRERRLIAHGEIQSVYYPDGDWTPALSEYWARAVLPARELPPGSRALVVGLGGATQVHLLRRQTPVGPITVVERDPVVIRIAHEWFALAQVSQVEILDGDVEDAIAELTLAGRIFEFVMDDISYAADPAEAVHRARLLAGRLAPGGTLVLNQHYRVQAQHVAASISDLLPRIRLERVRRGVENVLVFASPAPGP
jgi:predicted membrane-bound spermidine synthase